MNTEEKKMSEYFDESCNTGWIMDLITPLVGWIVPKEITKFSEQNTYMKDNFGVIFEKEYGFKPYFRILDNEYVHIDIMEDPLHIDRFGEICSGLKKIKGRLGGGFKVYVNCIKL
jgi:hypothetical protein